MYVELAPNIVSLIYVIVVFAVTFGIPYWLSR